MRTITVRYFETQGCEDLFKEVVNGKTTAGRVFARQPANCDEIVFWYTTCKWSGGYEADCHIKEGITMQVVDKAGTVLFEEVLEKDNWNDGTSAKKNGEFFGETIRRLCNEVAEAYFLTSYEEWSKQLVELQNIYGNTDYKENWLHCYNNVLSNQKLKDVSILGSKFHLTKILYKHRVCDKKWWSYQFIDSIDGLCTGLCGYIFA